MSLDEWVLARVSARGYNLLQSTDGNWYIEDYSRVEFTVMCKMRNGD